MAPHFRSENKAYSADDLKDIGVLAYHDGLSIDQVVDALDKNELNMDLESARSLIREGYESEAKKDDTWLIAFIKVFGAAIVAMILMSVF